MTATYFTCVPTCKEGLQGKAHLCFKQPQQGQLHKGWRIYFQTAHSCGSQTGAGCWVGAQLELRVPAPSMTSLNGQGFLKTWW